MFLDKRGQMRYNENIPIYGGLHDETRENHFGRHLGLAFLLTATVICTLPAEATEAPAEISTEDMTEAPTDEAIKEYTVTFVVSGNLETPPAVKVKAGECVVEPAVGIPKDGSVFYGWYTAADLSEDTKFDFLYPHHG